MTNREWLDCRDVYQMLDFLEGKLSERKLRLLACAFCRVVWPSLSEPRSRAAVDAAEEYADGTIALTELGDAALGAMAAADTFDMHLGDSYAVLRAAYACEVVSEPCLPFSIRHVGRTLGEVLEGFLEDDAAGVAAEGVCCDLCRDLCTGLLWPAQVPQTWLAWEGGLVSKLGQSIYEERAFERLPILADALTDAGCGDPKVLGHCREPGIHSRGCWLIDSLIRKR
jgi:hypothetical protein